MVENSLGGHIFMKVVVSGMSTVTMLHSSWDDINQFLNLSTTDILGQIIL